MHISSVQGNSAVRPPVVIEQSVFANDSPVVEVSDIVREYGLNTEQARAFSIIANHSKLAVCPNDPLRMFIGGAGGTDKSRVITALRDFFERRGEARRFRLASFMGVAARNISGMTLHAVLGLGQRGKSGARGKTKRDLITMWEGVDYLLIDEVSMIGCNFLVKISEALT
ncbi:hypothetical protein BV22DRAFT_999410, partial [Leucogyrophana mollusca]